MSIHSTILSSAVSALGLFALLAAPFTSNALGAAEGAPVINSVCPMDGKPVDPAKGPTVPIAVGEGADAKHYRMAFCQESCCDEFKKNPGETLKKAFKLGPKAWRE